MNILSWSTHKFATHLLVAALVSSPLLSSQFLARGPRHINQRSTQLQTYQDSASTPRIFQIGFNKCGTTSLAVFFNKNHIKSVHWDAGKLAQTIHENYLQGKPLLEPHYAKCIGFFDMENNPTDPVFIAQELFQELDRQYPGSKFILNTRNKDAWLKSRSLHRFDQGKQNYLTATAEQNQVSEEETLARWSQEWDDHLAAVKEYFKDRPQDLLVFDIESDSPSKLCEFFEGIYPLDPSFYGQHYKTDPSRTR